MPQKPPLRLHVLADTGLADELPAGDCVRVVLVLVLGLGLGGGRAVETVGDVGCVGGVGFAVIAVFVLVTTLPPRHSFLKHTEVAPQHTMAGLAFHWPHHAPSDAHATGGLHTIQKHPAVKI